MFACAAHDDAVTVRSATLLRQIDLSRAADVETRDGVWIAGDFFGRSHRDDLAAVHACRGAYVNHVVGAANRLFVVFDDEHSVAEVA
jgi:hypothetical protein